MSLVPITGDGPPAVDPLDEDGLRAATAHLDRTEVVAPGVTLGEVLAIEERDPTPAGAVWRPNLVYGTAGAGGRPLRLHAYARADVTDRRPCVLFLHGGAWAGGHTMKHIRNANRLAAAGFVTATATYRLAHEARWPAALEDASCAVRFLRSAADDLGIDPDRIVVAGDSAGGNLAYLVALTPGRFEGEGGHAEVSSAVQGAFGLYPVTDVRLPGCTDDDLRRLVARYVAPDDDRSLVDASPISWVAPGAPVIHSVVGADDRGTPVPMLRAFHDALDEAGVPNVLTVVEGDAGHAFDLHPVHHARCRDLLDDLLAAAFR